MKKFGFDADKFVHELVDSNIGDHYPVPDRMLVHNEQVVHEYLEWAMCGNPRPKGKFKIYAGRGRHRRDVLHLHVAEEQPDHQSRRHHRARRADLHAVHRVAHPGGLQPQVCRGARGRRSTGSSIRTRSSTSLLVGAVAISEDTIRKIGAILKKRPDLILLTDDVYGTFVPGFRSLMGGVPEEHDRRLLVQQVFRLHRLAPGHGRRARGQHLRRNDRPASRAHQEIAGQALWRTHSRATQAGVHRSHRRGQQGRGAQSHGRPVAAATGDDDPLFAFRAHGRKEGLSESLHRVSSRSGSRPRSKGWASSFPRTSSSTSTTA